MTLSRLCFLTASLATTAIALVLPGSAAAQGSAGDVLIRKFYGSYPCMEPKSAIEAARRAPQVPFAIFNGNRPARDRFAAYHLIVEARLTGYELVVKIAMDDRSPEIRAAAVHHLPRAVPPEQLPEIYIGLLDDSSTTMRYYGAEKLAQHPSRQAIEPLLKLLGDESIETRHRAAWTLLSWDCAEIKPALRSRLKSDDTTVAGVASCALAGFSDEPIRIATLHSYLAQELPRLTGPPYSGNDNVVHIIRRISERGDQSSLPVLQSAAKHKHTSVQKAAIQAIARIQERKDR